MKLTDIIKNESNQAVATTQTPQSNSSSEETKTQDTSSVDFYTSLKSFLKLDDGKNIDEEALFAGLLAEGIRGLKGEEAAKQYEDALATRKSELARADGYVPLEDAARAALKDVREAGLISKEEADTIHSEAFAAAQLDGNTDALFDGRGSSEDGTVAVALLESALTSAKAMLDKFSSKELTATVRTLDGTSSNGSIDYSVGLPTTEISGAQNLGEIDNTKIGSTGKLEGFLYKPVSESNGKLVVLTPPKLTGKVSKVVIRDAEGKKLEEGRYDGVKNGGREHFRFSKAGAEYGDDLDVVVRLKNGKKKTYHIKSGAKRYE